MRFLFAALCAAICVGVAACGGSPSASRRTTPATPPVRTVNGHACNPANEVLQCVLPPAPPRLLLQQSPFVLHGVDFGWGGPSAANLRARGLHFGASYLSHDPEKNWRASQVAEYHRAGLGTVAVWETSAGRARDGCTAGRTDAFYAARQAAELGNATRPVIFAIDFEASGPDVAPYFFCARQSLPGRVEAYGGYYPLKYLCAHGLVGHQNWQTYAWSGGQWLPASCAPLEQYLNDSSVDYDRAIAPDYAQWPAPALPPVDRKALEARIRAIQRWLVSYGCRRRVSQHQHLGPRCIAHFKEGDRRHHELGR